MSLTELLLIYLALINVVAFFAYGIDKLKARRGRWRIPESTLLLLAAIGGSVGALLGIWVWHHKTMHRTFTVGVPAMLVAQLGLVAVLSFSGCSNNLSVRGDNPKTPMTGAYGETRAVTDEERTLFNATYRGDLELTPVSVSSQVVAGMNYRFVCKDKKGDSCLVTIFRPLPSSGNNPEVKSVVRL